MNHPNEIVTGKKGTDSGRLPEGHSEYVLLAQQLHSTGLLEEIASRLLIYRQGGYTSVDAVLFLLAFFCSGHREGLSGFDDDVAPYRPLLAAAGGLRRFPTQASMSRFLRAVDGRMLEEFVTWLLLNASGMMDVLNHPTMAVCDTHGNPWHFFDLDGTLTVFRQRCQPHGTDLPEARRDVGDDVAKPGYSGRKRGDVQLCRSTLAHLGSSAWLGLWVNPGNEDATRVPAQAAAAVCQAAHEAGIEPSRCVLRFDGLYGRWTTIEACKRAGIAHLLRWSSYELLQDPQVIEQLENATWERVDSSLSGPTRYATELCIHTCPARQYDGVALTTRLVVSRYADTGHTGAGLVIDGYRYELYATGLSPEAFGASEVVTLYYGRVAEENRFGQEDRELGLDHLFSTNLGGQHLTLLIGLFLWNLRVRRGLDLEEKQLDEHPSVEPTLRQVTVQSDDQPTGQRNELMDELERLDWDNLLERSSQWLWSSNGLLCPAGRLTPLKTVRRKEGQARILVFRAQQGACQFCPQRAQCIRSAQPRSRKEHQFTVAPSRGEEILRLKRQGLQSVCFDATKPQTADVSGWQLSEDVQPGPFAVKGPHLIPSAPRHEFRKRCLRLIVKVIAIVPPPKAKASCIADTPAERQRRRMTWAEKHMWNQLPPEAYIRVTVLGKTQEEAELLLNAGSPLRQMRGRAA